MRASCLYAAGWYRFDFGLLLMYVWKKSLTSLSSLVMWIVPSFAAQICALSSRT